MANEINSAYKHLSLFYANEKFLTNIYDFKNHIKESLYALGFKYDLDKIVNDVIVNSLQGNLFVDTSDTDNVLIVYNSVDNTGEVLKLDTMQDIAVFTKVISDLIKE